MARSYFFFFDVLLSRLIDFLAIDGHGGAREQAWAEGGGARSGDAAPKQESLVHFGHWFKSLPRGRALGITSDILPLMTDLLNLERIRRARERLSGRVVATPCRESPKLTALTGGTVILKLENVQRTGSFKERGACNRLLTLSDDEKRRGVVAASAGNHAQAVAYHAGRLGIAATVVMPTAAPLVKVAAARDFGARVVLHGQNYDEAAAHALSLAQSEGGTVLHPFEDVEVIAGQGTIGLELLEQVQDLEAIVVPVGGGGLIAGIACAVKETKPDVLIYGVESETFPGMKRALEHAAPPELLGGKTIADGIAVREVGSIARGVVERYVDGIELVDEEEIAEAILMLLEGDKTVAEGREPSVSPGSRRAVSLSASAGRPSS